MLFRCWFNVSERYSSAILILGRLHDAISWLVYLLNKCVQILIPTGIGLHLHVMFCISVFCFVYSSVLLISSRNMCVQILIPEVMLSGYVLCSSMFCVMYSPVLLISVGLHYTISWLCHLLLIAIRCNLQPLSDIAINTLRRGNE